MPLPQQLLLQLLRPVVCQQRREYLRRTPPRCTRQTPSRRRADSQAVSYPEEGAIRVQRPLLAMWGGSASRALFAAAAWACLIASSGGGGLPPGSFGALLSADARAAVVDEGSRLELMFPTRVSRAGLVFARRARASCCDLLLTFLDAVSAACSVFDTYHKCISCLFIVSAAAARVGCRGAAGAGPAVDRRGAGPRSAVRVR